MLKKINCCIHYVGYYLWWIDHQSVTCSRALFLWHVGLGTTCMAHRITKLILQPACFHPGMDTAYSCEQSLTAYMQS
jgi:hypothetical protein